MSQNIDILINAKDAATSAIKGVDSAVKTLTGSLGAIAEFTGLF